MDSPLPRRISIVTLGVDDLEASAAFYERLGWQRAASSTPDIVWFTTSDSVLGLFPRELLAEDAALPSGPAGSTPRPLFGGITLAVNVESEAAVDAGLATAVEAGATLLRPAEKVDWGGYRGYFADPDGYPWEVAHNPFVGFRPDGSLDMT